MTTRSIIIGLIICAVIIFGLLGYAYWAVGNITYDDVLRNKDARIDHLELYGN